ncbi:MAG: hypothetical protein FWG87_12750 [Defluviitaleaceae bacterium]|nr:hypothetical protein [Defluviitaleaceae bacterium]
MGYISKRQHVKKQAVRYRLSGFLRQYRTPTNSYSDQPKRVSLFMWKTAYFKFT